MLDPDSMRAAVRAYAEGWRTGDAGPWLALFAEGAEIVDPAGTAPHRGREAIAELWRSVHRRMQLELHVERIVICGDEAMVPFTLDVTTEGGSRSTIDVVDLFRFDGEGRITSMRAYWDAACVRRA